MQLDMFSEANNSAIIDAAPPVMAADGSWRPPEALAFDAALKRGALDDALTILLRLKAAVVAKVLLSSGFSVGSFNNRGELIAGAQADLVAAARGRMTGTELRASRVANLAEPAHNGLSDNARVAPVGKESRNGSVDQPGGIPAGGGGQDRAVEYDSGVNRESLDARLAGAGGGATEGGNVSGGAGGANGTGEGRVGGSGASESSGSVRNPTDVRDQRGSADGGVDANVGREWQSEWGTQRIVERRVFKSGDLYAVQSLDGLIRQYPVSRIEDIIKRNEFNITEEAEQNRAQDRFKEKRYQELLAQRKVEAEKAEIEKHNLDGFGENLDKMRLGKVEATLSKEVLMNGKVTTLRDAVRTLVSGGAITSTDQVDVIKDMTRAQFNRADQRTQDEHARKQREAGKKTEYYVGDYELGKTAYDYANHLIELDAKNLESTSSEAENVKSSQEHQDYVLTDEDRIGLGGLAEKFQDNLQAIRVLRTLEAENRLAVDVEKRMLARYVGWGGLKGVFDPDNKQWGRQHVALKALLSDAEWAAASRSQLDAFYTAPVVGKAMYSAVFRLGFRHGRFLEPSVGVGNFFGLMPEEMQQNSSLHGVELDILTSQIVAALYPSAKIAKATGFQSYQVPAGYFDMVAGNPPFGNQTVSDEVGSAYSGWSIHNYFFAKSIDMLRPGGIMPMVVSHNFLDKLDPHVRRWIGRRAELVSGVRLPYTAFKENANTEVVTDVLIFRRLDNENLLGKQAEADWLDTSEVMIENPKTGVSEAISINNYFVNNPQNVLGTNATASSQFRANEYTVLPNGDLETQLADWVASLPQGIYVPLERSAVAASLKAVEMPDHVKEGSFYIQGEQVWQRLPDAFGEQRAQPWEAPNARALERMVGMIHIREMLRAQMKLERTVDSPDAAIESGRRAFNTVYDNFTKKNGLLNDPINRRLFLDDTESSLIQALEFDYEKAITPAKAEEYGTEPRAARAVKADIFSRRVLFPPVEIEIVETAKDALLHSLNITGRVDMEYMQSAYGKDEESIIAELGDLLYVDPIYGLATADEYLSGDVKTKLVEAMKVAEGNVSLERNVEALQAVIPVDKLPSEIHAAIGAAWVPSDIYKAFAKEVSGADAVFSYVKATGQWLEHTVTSADYAKNNNEYGTEEMSALTILTHTMNSRGLEVKKRVTIDGQDKYVTDEVATEAVRQKGDKLRAHWDSWLWSDGDRADKLTAIYNDRFNRTVERQYDGSHLTFPGMSPVISLLAHQKNGVWRGLQDRTMLADQVVGAGKTFELAAMVMEMRRLGITKKPMFAVPNHLTLQWRSEFYRLYPGANVLAATPQDFDKENRERLFSKIVTGNWDAVIVGHSSLKKIAIPLEAEMKIVKEQFDDIADAIEAMKRERGDRNVIRDMEKIKGNLEAKLVRMKEKGGKKDNVVDFADLGVDALIVDEMHEFKNLFFTTQMNRVAGLGNPTGSGKAFDLFVKIRWLKDTFGEKAPLITATGTPISNSLAEMFTMQRYMQYDKLKANGLHVFDAWAKQYGDVQNVYEVAPSGTGYRLSQRFAKFKNLPSLMGSYRSFADVITLDDLKAQEIAQGKTFPVPGMVGGRPLNVVAQRSALQEKFFGVSEIVKDEFGEIQFEVDLSIPAAVVQQEDGKFKAEQVENGHVKSANAYDTAEEAAYMFALAATTPRMTIDPHSIVGQFENLRELTRKTKGKINALSLTGLANKAGLDYRLIDPAAEDFPGSKINQAVRKMIATAKVWEADKGTQLVFCDLSVPLSAKAKMASKEKRVYVRDDDGHVTHKKGTLHTIKEYEGFPYYLVAAGKGTGKTFSMYDPVTGQLLKDGFDSKQEAHQFAAGFVTKDGGQERWMDLREQSPGIAPDEIDDYKNEHSLDVDGDAADVEISAQDVEGATGVSGFSIYDDMKAKLVKGGIPANQIEFIHDHDTPQAKDALFKRVNAGDVRFLFGSTPKMGAGTNVQKRLVGLHHIDAPWRPSDLEQREGRIIRRGNMLYERDPEGFKVEVNRYATAQTYDTRRWQLLEHKASGLEQLRNYDGANEIEDVANEASNSADMKAAASGNPLILKETQLATEVKKLHLLERAHRDGDYVVRSRMHSSRNYAERFGPDEVAKLQTMQMQRDSATVLGIYEGRQLVDKDAVLTAAEKIALATEAMDSKKTLIYRGLKFDFEREIVAKAVSIRMPNGEKFFMEKVSPSGVITRMDNWCKGIEEEIAKFEMRIARSAEDAEKYAGMLGKPFDQAEQLKTAIAEHGKVQRALMKSNSMAAVKPEEMAAFEAVVGKQKLALIGMGFAVAVREIAAGDGVGADDSLESAVVEVAPVEAANDDIENRVFSGKILYVMGGKATQKIGRAGETMEHDVSKLSEKVRAGAVVDIRYRGGVGVVEGLVKSVVQR